LGVADLLIFLRQYAVHSLRLLVVAWHGQVEPTAVALGLAALWAARRGRTGVGGLLLGLAASVKTWPVLFVPGVLRETPRRRWPLLAAVAAAAARLDAAAAPQRPAPFPARARVVPGDHRDLGLDRRPANR
jgi:uncharacterized membrane protein